MANKSKVFTGRKVLLPGEEQPQPATIIVDTLTGKITDVLTRHATPRDLPEAGVAESDWTDAGDDVVLPGLVEWAHFSYTKADRAELSGLSAHVHLNEPGRTDWEGFWTGTRAAASGGVTTVVDMPLNSIPPTTTVEYLEAKRAAARGQWIDVAFWGGVIPGNQVSAYSFSII